MDATITIVIPAYNEGQSLTPNMNTLLACLADQGIVPRLLLVDDGSKDGTWGEIQALGKSHAGQVTGLRFSRNFGKEAAIMAGVAHVETDRCLVMDADLQHPPEVIPQMLRAMEESGADIVEGVKTSRGRESVMYRLFAKGFYRVMGLMSGLNLDDSSDFKLLSRKVIDTVAAYREQEVFFRGLVDWSGFSRVQVPFAVAERQGGESKFTLRKLMGMSVNAVLSYTSKPLYLTIVIGALFLVGALILMVNTLYMYLTGRAVSGFTTVILLQLIVGGLILLCLGIIGLYISRIYNEVKGRPQYIVAERTGGED